MASQVAGPSRLPALGHGYVSEPLSSSERQRLLATNKKAERILGASAPASIVDLSKRSKDPGGAVVLNSPVTVTPAPPSAFRWDTRMYTSFAEKTTSSQPAEGTNTPPSPSGAQHYVPPLKFKRESSRNNSNSSSAEAELIEFRKGLANLSLNNSPPHDNATDSMVRSDSTLRRHPRPLPPVPPCVSRPASPVSSSSSSNTPPGPMRPLPLPPDARNSKRPVSGETVSTIGFAPPSPHLKCLIPNASSITLSCSPVEPEAEAEKEAPSPVSIVSAATDATSTLSILTPKFGLFMHETPPSDSGVGGGADRMPKHSARIHASPYKLARSASRYSVTSLSSQVSAPPVPPAEELRRRNREKMSKLIRMLGDSPPPDMVFAIESAYAELQSSLDKEVEITTAKRVGPPVIVKNVIEHVMIPPKPKIEHAASSPPGRPSLSSSLSSDVKFHGRSFSLSGCSEEDTIFARKTLSDPDAGHFPLSTFDSNNTITTNTTVNSMFPFTRLRPKKGRSGSSSERYVVSLAGGDAERVSLRLAGSGANGARMKPSGSYLRGAFKDDPRALEVKVPPLPNTRVSLLAPKPKLNLPQETRDRKKNTRKWVREAGSTRWEEEDYENIVRKLRKL